MAKTKIVATLGPSSDSLEAVRQLIHGGVSVVRLNMSHGTHQEHGERIQRVRQAAKEQDAQTAILMDLQGPKIRLGTFEKGGCILEEGGRFVLTTQQVSGTCERASCSYPELATDVQAGDRVLLADGALELRVCSSDGTEVVCDVVRGGPVSDHKGINLPGVHVSSPSLTKKDVADLRFGIENGIDLVALSFVRKRDDVLRLRVHLEDYDAKLPIVSKIEKPEAWTNFDSILGESDGVMVARGDLGVELAPERVPSIQKSIIRRARQAGKFVITATQMLESMMDRSYPTRAEVSDVANAIYDGTDAVMLSGETAAGKYPLEAARMMERIATEAEVSVHFRDLPRREDPTHADVVADAAYRAAQAVNAQAIVVFTATGSTARLVSRFRPPVPIYAFTPKDTTARQLQVSFGARAVIAPDTCSTDEMLQQLDLMLLQNGCLKKGDTVVFVAGQPIGRPGTTNLLKLHCVGELH
jgi:pyruvate kinase